MADLRKLKNKALEAASKGNWRKAASYYANLEKDEPAEPAWSLKLGESLRKMGQDGEAIKALGRAVRAYAKKDLLLKAIAVCKIILGIDPKHSHTQELLASFYESQRKPTNPGVPLPNRTQSPPPVMQAASLPPPLRHLHLAALVPGSRKSRQIPSAGSSAAMEIPIDDGFEPVAAIPTTPHMGAGRNTLAHRVLPKTPLFSVLSRDLFCMAVERVQLIQLAEGDILFSRGDPGDVLYVVASGEIARLSEGEFFGEIALLTDRPRTATVRATLDTQILAIDRALLGDLVAGSPEVLKVLLRFLRERLVAMLAETSPLFAPFTPLERIGLAARFHFLEIDEGLRIVEEGEKSSGLFVLLAGEAKATTGERTLANLESGDVFGEISLIANQPATATVVTLCKSFVLYLPRPDFSEVIMTHPQVLEHISSLADRRIHEIGRIDMQ